MHRERNERGYLKVQECILFDEERRIALELAINGFEYKEIALHLGISAKRAETLFNGHSADPEFIKEKSAKAIGIYGVIEAFYSTRPNNKADVARLLLGDIVFISED